MTGTPAERAELEELRRLEEARRQARERMRRVRAAAKALGPVPPDAPVEKLTYSVPEAARKLGIGANSAYKAAQAGQIPPADWRPHSRSSDSLGADAGEGR